MSTFFPKDDHKTEPSPPSVSGGTIGDDPQVKAFMESLKEPQTVKTAELYVEITWNGRKEHRTIGPIDSLFHGKQAQGKDRLYAAAYLVRRDGNRCTIRGPTCTQGEAPFEHPEGADFDHIDPVHLPLNQASNLRLACHPCNSWEQPQQRREILHRKPNPLPASTKEREREDAAHSHARSFKPSSREMAQSSEQFPATVRDAFHPQTGRLAKLGQSVLKKWYVNNLPDLVGIGRATTFGKYIDEFVEQGYLIEEPGEKGVRLVRTGKNAASLLWRELGLRLEEKEAVQSEEQAPPAPGEPGKSAV